MDVLKTVLNTALSAGKQQGSDNLLGTIGGAVLGNLLGSNANGVQQGQSLLTTLFGAVGGIHGLISLLTKGGLAQQVSSWISTGPNQSVTGEQVSNALGSDMMSMLAQQIGGDTKQASGLLAQLLPVVVNQLTPDGKPPAADAASNPADLLGILGGLLGGSGNR